MTEFDRGLRRFGYLLTSAMFVLVFVVFVVHVVSGPAAARDAAVLDRAGGRAQPRAAAGHSEREPGARRPR